MKKQAAPINRILPGIQTYAWNSDCTRVAVCPQSREILIFETNQSPDISKWKLVQELREVSKTIGHIFCLSVALL